MTTIDTISIEVARQRVELFRSWLDYKNYFTPPPNEEFMVPLGAKAFTMLASELLNAAQAISDLRENNPDLNAVRFYLGTKMQWVRIDERIPAEYIPVNCLIMVPVEKFQEYPLQEQIVVDGTRQQVITQWPAAGADVDTIMGSNGQPQASVCYDFTYPCPPTCPESLGYLPAPATGSQNSQ